VGGVGSEAIVVVEPSPEGIPLLFGGVMGVKVDPLVQRGLEEPPILAIGLGPERTCGVIADSVGLIEDLEKYSASPNDIVGEDAHNLTSWLV